MKKNDVLVWLDSNAELLQEVARDLWERPELPFAEEHAARLQSEILEKAGFAVRRNLADLPTAFVAEYGSGRPILGILGEYDALAKLSQTVSSRCEPVRPGAPGHGCGHNLLGTAGMGAALAIRQAMESGAVAGTIRYYGCPAEETLGGKVFMAREGIFDDLDACLTWHPASMNVVWGCSFLALNSVEFRFRGTAAHAAAAPHLGRSALDAVELMNVGSNYLREHIPEQARLHYTITNGGGAPNIVPAEASAWYYIRAPKRHMVEEIFERLTKIAQGASLMTETEASWALLAGCYDVLPNAVLGELLNKNMAELGGPCFAEEERAFARELAKSFGPAHKEKVMQAYFAPPEIVAMDLHEGVVAIDDRNQIMAGSSDVGDVSWLVPLAQFTAATWPVGTAAHSWQATAASGSGIGFKAMQFAAKTLAGTAFDLLSDGGEILALAKAEFAARAGASGYKSPLPEGAKPVVQQ
ncbi:MAG TPA: amidohydrolase [Selenomonadales bacterium]|nr:amidohydrolase [Selenomonadales bacterium]